MSFKFLVGQAVEYTPIGEKVAGLYRIKKQMPREEQAFDLKYLIKSEAEAYERNVLECQLSSDVGVERQYATTKPPPARGAHVEHRHLKTCVFRGRQLLHSHSHLIIRKSCARPPLTLGCCEPSTAACA